jgi:hypothetical protein
MGNLYSTTSLLGHSSRSLLPYHLTLGSIIHLHSPLFEISKVTVLQVECMTLNDPGEVAMSS